MTPTRKLADADVFPIGLGGMPMSLSGRPPEERSIRTIHAALDAGVNLIDTADAYSKDDSDVGHNERLIAKAIGDRRDQVIVATKGGHTRTADGGWELDGTPEHLRSGLRGLAEGAQHRPDRPLPVPPARPGRALRGVRRHAQGAPGRGQGALDRALQRQLGADRGVARHRGHRCPCRTSCRSSTPTRSASTRSSCASGAGSRSCRGRRSAGSRRPPTRPARTTRCGRSRTPTASRRSRSRSAWLLALSPVVIPIPGASRPESILDSVKAVDLQLTHEELQSIGRIAQPA